MSGVTLEEFMKLAKPKPSIQREDLDKLSDDSLDQLMTKKYGYPRFGKWSDYVVDRESKINFIVTGEYPDIYKSLPHDAVV